MRKYTVILGVLAVVLVALSVLANAVSDKIAKAEQGLDRISVALDEIELALSAQNGQALFKKSCALCHGANGEGLPPDLPSLRDGHAKHMTDEELFKKITQGGNGTGMPPFGKVYSPEQIRDIISHIRELQK